VYTVYIKYRRLDMKRLNLNMGDELNSRMEREALRAEMTISELIRRAVEEYLDRRKTG
jgi:metal-responsive CopG/Arc/MetJ family transcriptional regulator